MKDRVLAIPIAFALTCLLIFFTDTAKASYFLPDLTNVGGLDTFIIEADKVGSPDNEALWVQGVLGDPTVDWTISQANVPYTETTTTGIWAFEILDDPGYFIIKNSNRIALYSNNVDLGYGVFDQDDLSSALNVPTDPWQISHVTSLNGGGTTTNNDIPEPLLSLMIGFGLVAVGVIRK